LTLNFKVAGDEESFESFVRAGSVRRNFDQRIKDTRTRGRDGMCAANLSESQVESLLNYVESRLLNASYEFSPYKEVLRLKGASKLPRVISIPTVGDRLALAVLAEYLRGVIPAVEFPRPQELVSKIRSAVNSGEYRDFIRLDIKTFYPSISHDAVSGALKRNGIASNVVEMVLRAINTPTIPGGGARFEGQFVCNGVPAGTSIANVLGEIVLHKLDARVTSEPGVAYFRYVDDVVVLGPYGKRTSLTKTIGEELREVGLSAHPKKVKEKSASGVISRAPFEYLGYTFADGQVRVENARTAKLISSVARPITMLRRAVAESRPDLERIQARAEWWLNLRITGCIVDGTRRGWLPYYSQIDDIGRLHRLDAVVAKLLKRVPQPWSIESKSFLKAYTFMRDTSRDRDQYIPNFDLVVDPAVMRAILEQASDYRSIPSDSVAVEVLFRRFVKFATAELEADVGGVS